MDSECSPEALLSFLRLKGGRVRSAELTEHFRSAFPADPQRKARLRDAFTAWVGEVAFVKTENGVKYVCLRKKFRHDDGGGGGTEEGGAYRRPPRAHVEPPAGEAHPPPGSGYRKPSPVGAPRGSLQPPAGSAERPEHGTREEVTCASGEMGNRGSIWREKRGSEREEAGGEKRGSEREEAGGEKRGSEREEAGGEKRGSEREEAGGARNIPQITVIEASPLPADGAVFSLPESAQAPAQTAPQVEECAPADTGSLSQEDAPRGTPPDPHDDDGRSDSRSLSGSEGSATPKASRRHFLQAMMSSSPQVRRSLVMRGSIYLPSKSDSDSASVASSNADLDEEDAASVALDPIEHEWMLCASDGEWASLYRLLTTEPALLLRKDFVTGFTCLHWAAKHGKPELIALIVNFAKQHRVPVSVDVRSNAGYTPLHIAAMHNHMEVVKLLVGAYNADVEIRDYSGKKACQYLTDKASVDIRDIIGQYELSEAQNAGCEDGRRWRFSKVLQSNLKPLRLLSNDGDSVDAEGRRQDKPLRRKSSLSGMRPKLQRLRVRTSQIVHSATFHDTEDLEKSGRGSWRSRPKTHFFG